MTELQQNRGGSSYNHSATGVTQQGQAPPMNMSRPPPLLKRNDNQDSAFCKSAFIILGKIVEWIRILFMHFW